MNDAARHGPNSTRDPSGLVARDLTLPPDMRTGERSVAAREAIHSRGDPLDHLYVVRSGWLFSSTSIPDGRRQIVQIHHAGDLIGVADLVSRRASTDLQTMTDVHLDLIPIADIDAAIGRRPELGRALLASGLRELAVLSEKIRVLGRMTAREKIAFFLLDMLHSLRVHDPGIVDTYRLPFTQCEIGDTVGLTSVTVSKTLMALQLEKLIDRREGKLRLREIGVLTGMCDYRDPYSSF